jgi:hypothetical protein
VELTAAETVDYEWQRAVLESSAAKSAWSEVKGLSNSGTVHSVRAVLQHQHSLQRISIFPNA